jgi:hypothetical protein
VREEDRKIPSRIIETDSECSPPRLAAGLASEYREIIPYVKNTAVSAAGFFIKGCN